MIQILGTEIRVTTTATLFKKLPEILGALQTLTDVEFTIAHHTGPCSPATFDFQTVLAFRAMVAREKVFDAADALASVLKAPRETITVIKPHGAAIYLVHLKNPIRGVLWFNERAGALYAICAKWEKAAKDRGIFIKAERDVFLPDATIPLPGTTDLDGHQIELLQYSDAVLDIVLPKKKTIADYIRPYARAAFLEWARNAVEKTFSRDDFVGSDQAYQSYLKWCDETGRKIPISKHNFCRAMRDEYVEGSVSPKERFRSINGVHTRGFPRVRLK